jgi:hypothetical protein
LNLGGVGGVNFRFWCRHGFPQTCTLESVVF